jgi:hypothetical protein
VKKSQASIEAVAIEVPGPKIPGPPSTSER